MRPSQHLLLKRQSALNINSLACFDMVLNVVIILPSSKLDWKKLSGESSLISPQQPSQSREWTEVGLFVSQEAQVVSRVTELRKEGLWSSKRLPRVQEPPRQKAHWDYLLEEMTWLAADFVQERKWKKAAARKVSRREFLAHVCLVNLTAARWFKPIIIWWHMHKWVGTL